MADDTKKSTGNPKYEFDAFIAFSYENEDIAFEVYEYLTTKIRLKVQICKDFEPGTMISDNIGTAVKSSRKCIVILSKGFLKSEWCSLEQMYMIHQSTLTKRSNIIVVNVDLLHEDVPGRLQPYSYIDCKQNSLTSNLDLIASAVQAPDMPMDVALPCGNISQGLVWSFYYGYLKLILPGFHRICRESAWWKTDDPTERTMVDKLFVVIPDSGFCPGLLEEVDSRIKFAGKLPKQTVNRAGLKAREYINSLYSFPDDDGRKYYAACEYATPVMSMYEMCVEGQSGLDETEKDYQIVQFRQMLDRVLSHVNDEHCRNNYRLIRLKDKGPDKNNLATEVMNAIKEILSREARSAGLPGRPDDVGTVTNSLNQSQI